MKILYYQHQRFLHIYHYNFADVIQMISVFNLYIKVLTKTSPCLVYAHTYVSRAFTNQNQYVYIPLIISIFNSYIKEINVNVYCSTFIYQKFVHMHQIRSLFL